MKVARERGEVSGPHRDGVMDPANGELGPEEIWKEPADRLLERLGTTPAGLDTVEVQSRLTTYGPNDAREYRVRRKHICSELRRRDWYHIISKSC